MIRPFALAKKVGAAALHIGKRRAVAMKLIAAAAATATIRCGRRRAQCFRVWPRIIRDALNTATL